MKGTRCLIIQMKRAVCSFRFVFACLGSAVLMYVTGVQYLTSGIDAIGVWEIVRGSGIFIMTLAILPLFPFSLSYAEEHNEKNLSFWVIRAGVKSYIMTKYIAAVLSGMLSYVVGTLLFILACSLRTSLFYHISSWNAYVSLLENGQIMLYLVVILIHFSFSAAIFCGLTMCVSVWFSNRFAAVILPMVVYFMIGRMMANMPWYFTIIGLIEGVVDAGTVGLSLLVKGAVSLVLLTVMAGIVLDGAERRMRNE